ncbi:hypothetical protein ACIBCU_26300 [Streptomyces sp. NPDC051064]|uniref:hypothetical protein n=1 Tax=Streptomyces sp. NPDC051064 TaxID=3365641 RepID=UPI003793E4D9
MALSAEQIRGRLYAVMAAVAAEGHTDVDYLLDDLGPDELGTLVHGLAVLALQGMVLPGTDTRAPEVRARLLPELQALVLERRLNDEP